MRNRRAAAGLLGIELTEVTAERVSCEAQVRAELCTLGGILHGGAVMALADTLGAVGAFLNLPPNAPHHHLDRRPISWVRRRWLGGAGE